MSMKYVNASMRKCAKITFSLPPLHLTSKISNNCDYVVNVSSPPLNITRKDMDRVNMSVSEGTKMI